MDAEPRTPNGIGLPEGDGWCLWRDPPHYPGGGGIRLQVRGTWRPELLAVCRQYAVRRVQVLDWEADSLDFLTCIGDQITSLSLCDGIRDLRAINGLKHLIYLSAKGNTGQIDFTQLPALRELEYTNSKVLGNMLECPWLGDLSIFCLPSLAPLAGLTALRRLKTWGSKLRSLEGLEHLHQLRRFMLLEVQLDSLSGIEAANGLTSLCLDGLPKCTTLAPLSTLVRLRHLTVGDCRHIADITPLQALPNLLALEIMHCHPAIDLTPIGNLHALRALALDDMGRIPSISFIGHLPCLRAFRCTGNTRILDNDTSVLLTPERLEYVQLSYDARYTHKTQDIEAVLRQRGRAVPEWVDFERYAMDDAATAAEPDPSAEGETNAMVTPASMARPAATDPGQPVVPATASGEPQQHAPTHEVCIDNTLDDAVIEVIAAHPRVRILAQGATSATLRRLMPVAAHIAICQVQNSDFTQLRALNWLFAVENLSVYETPLADLGGLEQFTQLRTLAIGQVKVADLTPLQGAPQLECLGISASPIVSLNGLDACVHMRELNLCSLRALTSLKQVTALRDLRKVHIASCPAIRDYEVLGQLLELAELVLDNDGSIPSLGFVRTLQNLQSIHFIESTKVTYWGRAVTIY